MLWGSTAHGEQSPAVGRTESGHSKSKRGAVMGALVLNSIRLSSGPGGHLIVHDNLDLAVNLLFLCNSTHFAKIDLTVCPVFLFAKSGKPIGVLHLLVLLPC